MHKKSVYRGLKVIQMKGQMLISKRWNTEVSFEITVRTSTLNQQLGIL